MLVLLHVPLFVLLHAPATALVLILLPCGNAPARAVLVTLVPVAGPLCCLPVSVQLICLQRMGCAFAHATCSLKLYCGTACIKREDVTQSCRGLSSQTPCTPKSNVRIPLALGAAV